MGVTFVVNPGSTSRKYAWYRNDERLLSVVVESSPAGIVAFVTTATGAKTQLAAAPESLLMALPFALELATEHKVYQSVSDCTTAVLRVVAPGEQFAKHQWLYPEYTTELATVAPLVPVHIPIVQAELQALQVVLPKARVAVVSDSAFHSSQDVRVRQTGLAAADAEANGWRRFGYHGLSVASIVRQIRERAGTVPKRTLVCHVGGGISVTALRDGVSVANSMGLTPASGVSMGTRGGDMAADELAALLSTGTRTLDDVWQYLYSETGWYGKVGKDDLRTLLDAASDPASPAAETVASFMYQIQSYLAAYTVLLGGVDRIVLTGTASVRNSQLRQWLLSGLTVLGVNIDESVNESLRGNGVISSHDSAVVVEVLANDEFGEMQRVANELT